jgi:DNA-binding IclR family transcriptional regulator
LLGTVTRAGKALDLFTPERPVWGATAVARELGVAKSQAHELLVSLSEIGLLRRQPGGRYRLGWRTLALGRDVLRGQFPDDALRTLRLLAMRYQEPVMLVTFDRDRLTVVARYGSSAATGALLPKAALHRYVHCCAMAKCLIADLPEAERRAIVGTNLERFTPATPIDVEQLFAELEHVRAVRIAFDRGEVDAGLRAVAAPLKDLHGETIAAVGVWTTTARWERIGPELTRAVAGAGRRIDEAVRRATPATAEAAA